MKFPINPKDGDKISDQNGIVYKYDSKTDTWIDCGVVVSPPIASKESDGLVTPELYRKLNLIKILKDRGINWNAFQLATSSNKKPYFYYFNSSDDLIKFIPESTNKLRIEVNRQKLYSKLLSLCCAGPKGDKGEIGDTGEDGKPAANEIKHIPAIGTSGEYLIDASVNTPLDTDISLRFFNSDDQLLIELLLTLEGSITAIPGLVDIEMTSLELEYNKDSSSDFGSLVGKVTLIENTNDNLDGLYYKVRQRGPKGETGKDGSSFIEVIEDIVPDPGVLSTEAIITVRKSGVDDNLTFTKQDLFGGDSKNRFSSLHGITDFPLKSVTEDTYFALRVTTDDCKDIGKFKFTPNEKTTPELNIPDWTPMCNCTDTFRYQIQKFDWQRFSSNPVPFSIIQEPPPEDACCQEDFFWCPNQGDLCGVGGSPGVPTRLPIQSSSRSGSGDGSSGGSSNGTGSTPRVKDPNDPYKGGFVPCPLPDQNAIELAGNGKLLGGVNNSGEVVTESVVVNRGKPDSYVFNALFDEPNTEFTIHVDVQIGHSDGTFDDGIAFAAPIDGEEGTPTPEQENCPCPLHTSMFVIPEAGAVSMLLPSPNQETQHDAVQNGGNSIERVTYTGKTLLAGTELAINVNANDTLLDCCLAYAVRITVESTVESDTGQDASPGSGAGTGDGDGDGLSGPSEEPPIDNPFAPSVITPPEVPVINLPPLDNGPIFVQDQELLDLPVEPDYKWRPIAITRPALSSLAPQMDGMLIGETNRILTMNANFSNKIQLTISTPVDGVDERSVVFPIDGDPGTTNMLWTVNTMEFERNGLFMEDGPLGLGFYFLQKNSFSVGTKYTKLGVTTRVDTFNNGFLYISGSSIEEVGPSSLAIISNGVDWTINSFAEGLTGFGSNWIKRVNRGVTEFGDAFFQVVLDSNSNLLRQLFSGSKSTVDDAFVSLVYNPYGCAILDIPETINSTIGDIVGGRDDPNCFELEPPIPNPPPSPVPPSPPAEPQTYTLDWDATDDVLDNSTGGNGVLVTIVITTSDGEPLVDDVTLATTQEEVGVIEGVDYIFDPTPSSIAFTSGSASGSSNVFSVVTQGTGGTGSVSIVITNDEFIGGSATYTFTTPED